MSCKILFDEVWVTLEELYDLVACIVMVVSDVSDSKSVLHAGLPSEFSPGLFSGRDKHDVGSFGLYDFEEASYLGEHA